MGSRRGSLWSKWDLHVHTPASLAHSYSGAKEAQWDRFLSELESLPEEFKVIGINDYIFIDGYRRILEERRNGRLDNLDLVLPVIELRLELFAGAGQHLSRVNLHVLFSDEVPAATIEAQFLNALPNSYKLSPEARDTGWRAIPTRDSLEDLGRMILESTPAAKRPGTGPLQLGFSNINFSIDQIRETLKAHYFVDRHLIAVGKSEWADMRWSGQGVAEKKDVIQSAHMVFMAAESPEASIRARRRLREEQVTDRLLDCSDAHYFSDSSEKDRIGNCHTWIKAAPSFAGLCHALKEYDDRVFLGNEPPKVGVVRSQGGRFIRSIQIEKTSDADCQEEWFNCELSLNSDLVAIIGRKGSGKSALTDVIGLLSNADREDDFSFLNKRRFRKSPENKARSFSGTLTLENGTSITKTLDDHVDATSPPLVNYIPQTFFEIICSEIAKGNDAAFQRELEAVVFSRLSAAQRLGRASLRDLIDYRSGQIEESIAILREDLRRLDEGIAADELAMRSERREALTNKLEQRRQELRDLEIAKPVEVPAPSSGTDDAEIPEEQELVRARVTLDELDSQITAANSQLGETLTALAAFDRIGRALDNLEERSRRIEESVADDLRVVGLRWQDLAVVTVDRSPVHTQRDNLNSTRGALETSLDPDDPTSLSTTREQCERRIEELSEKLTEPERAYQRYVGDLASWREQCDEIRGTPESLGSIAALESELERTSRIPEELSAKRSERLEIVGQIFEKLEALVEQYNELYKPVQDFIDRHSTIRDKLGLSVAVRIRNKGFEDRFLRYIHRGVRGTFSGPGGPQFLSQLVEDTDFNSKSSLLSFVSRIDECLRRHEGSGDGEEFRVEDQLRKGFNVDEVYEYVFGLEYLEPQYSLELGDKQLTQLSPGERGALLLIFYLLVDDSRSPVVLDQPDENLDNETVFELLVPCIREAKRFRQVIIVTHNPNIAVVCDAEQIIHASMDKASNYKVTYTSGAIEDPTMNKHLLDVLEGTRPAFRNRDDKYFD